MSISVSIVGYKRDSDEYQCALQLKKLLEQQMPHDAIGEIILHANATLFGQTVKDIDILMIGTIQNLTMNLSFTNKDDDLALGPVSIESFCTTIEVKSHTAEAVWREGTDLYVKYREKTHCVTYQSNQQKIATMNYIQASRNYSPFVTNLIWFSGLTRTELGNILQVDDSLLQFNALPSSFSLKELMQLLLLQMKPKYYRGGYHFNSAEGIAAEDLAKVFKQFSQAKGSMGELTRKRIEQITSREIGQLILPEGKLLILRGRAGAGKTVSLIRAAIKLVDENDARVLILTYNRALVSDLKRLFALAELPDLFEDACVHISTMQSFFYKVLKTSICDGQLEGEYFLSHYDELISELLDFLNSDDEAVEMLRELLKKDDNLNWDYCLVDEAQDWSEKERDAILKLFGFDHIVVADGGQQFVRGDIICDWTTVTRRSGVKMKQCLRQKENLVSFINHLLEKLGRPENKILSSGSLPGGKIIICEGERRLFPICQAELEKLKRAGNIPYDMLFLVPAEMVSKEPRMFSRTAEFEKNGFLLWDGTQEDNRAVYSALGDEERVLQYSSARGLEAWTVVCLDLDCFLEEKMALFQDAVDTNSLLLESREDRRKAYFLNWLLIPLTRAIDTLVITVKDKNSLIARQLKELANEIPDYISYYEGE